MANEKEKQKINQIRRKRRKDQKKGGEGGGCGRGVAKGGCRRQEGGGGRWGRREEGGKPKLGSIYQLPNTILPSNIMALIHHVQLKERAVHLFTRPCVARAGLQTVP